MKKEAELHRLGCGSFSIEEAFKKKYSGIKADIRRIIIGEYLAFSPNIQ